MDLATEAPSIERNIPVSTGNDSSEPRQRESVRDTIRNSFARVREESDRQEREAKATPTDKPEETEEEETSAQDASAADRDTGSDADSGTSSDTEEESDSTEEKVETKPKSEAPTAWTKTAKEKWADLPDEIKKEVTKREADVEKGVKALKDRYKEVEDAIAPYDKVIQEFGKTRGQAVAQLFNWFDALAKNPDESFPALLNSYKYHPIRIVGPMVQQNPEGFVHQLAQYFRTTPQQLLTEIWHRVNPQSQVQQTQPGLGTPTPDGQAQNGQAQQPPPEWVQYIQGLQNELAGLKDQVGQRFTAQDQYMEAQRQQAEQQNAARTQEMLDQWAKDKKYFDKVRVQMGYLLTPGPDGNAAVPLSEGKVNLDEAYNRAIWMDPEIRQEMLAEQRAQEIAARKAKQEELKRKEQEKAAAARQASGSLTSSAPGAEVSRKTVSPKGLSVRDSLKQAISEIAGR